MEQELEQYGAGTCFCDCECNAIFVQPTTGTVNSSVLYLRSQGRTAKEQPALRFPNHATYQSI
jgi:hypothetical protein